MSGGNTRDSIGPVRRSMSGPNRDKLRDRQELLLALYRTDSAGEHLQKRPVGFVCRRRVCARDCTLIAVKVTGPCPRSRASMDKSFNIYRL